VLKRSGAAATVAVWAIALAARGAAVQSPDPPPSPASAGVYTVEQADRGKNVFASICTGCHTAASQSGKGFAKKWGGARLSELDRTIADTMPEDDPGRLTGQERADVIAYILQLNELAAGKDELPPDRERMKTILIDLSRDLSR
jgi:mono/diheme cytochrome c family protein